MNKRRLFWAGGIMQDQGSKATGALGVWRNVRWWVLAGVAVAVVLAIGIVLSVQLVNQTGALVATATNPNTDIAPKDRADLIRNAYQYQSDNLTKLWTAIIGSLTGIAAVAAGVIAWRNLRATQANLRATEAKLDIDREAQITDRFTKAIDQLGSVRTDNTGRPVANIEVRLGGIYALEKIAQDAPDKYHWTTMEVLTAYVRENARWIEPTATSPDGVVSSPEDAQLLQSPQQGERARQIEEPPPLRTDIQAVLTVLGRRTQSADRPEPARLDLHGTDLRRAEVEGIRLERALLMGAHLEWATLVIAHLEGTYLMSAHLEGAALEGAYLQGAQFGGAHLEGAELEGAYLQGTELGGAHLEGAELEGAYLQGTELGGAHLEGVRLGGAYLQGAAGLTQEQVYSADNHGEDAVLPADWPADWRDRFEESNEQSPVTLSDPT
jgi:uncharacterized protein YjbI with pentapeptide repeats